MKTSLKVGSVIGIPIEINYTWIIIFGLVTWSLASSWFPATAPGLQEYVYWSAAVISTFLLFLSLVLHELSHSFIAKRSGIPIAKITLFIFGGVAQMEKEPEDPKVEFNIAIAGPICSFCLGILFFLFSYTASRTGADKIVSCVFNYAGIINISLVIFNLIPGFPLDGGRILRSLIWNFRKNLKSATKISTNIGKMLSFSLMLIGLLYLFFMQFISGMWLLIIGFFLHEAAELSYQQLVLKKTLVGTKIKDVMTENVVTVSPDIPIDKLVNEFFYKHRHLGFPVAQDGYLKGMVVMQDVKKIPNCDWDKTPTSQIMKEVRADLLVCPADDALDALVQVTRSGLGKLLVVDKGKLCGIVTQRDLIKLFEIKEHLCEFKS